MDQDISRWLKDDLGLNHASESDINGLMFHPRHGGLCRRLVKFLAESTLCNNRYPNVYVGEEFDLATNELREKEKLLEDTMTNLRLSLRDNESVISNLNFCREKLSYLDGIEVLNRRTTEALEEMANRPNFLLDQINQFIQDPSYLGNLDLEEIYSADYIDKTTMQVAVSVEPPAAVPATTTNAARTNHRQISTTEECFNEQLGEAKLLLDAVNKLLASVTKRINDLDLTDLELKRINAESLAALKMPTCEEVTIETDLEEKELKEEGAELVARIGQIQQQVVELSGQYRSKRAELNRVNKRELERDLSFLKKLHDLEVKHLSSDRN